MQQSNFGEMALALIVSRTRLESDMIRLRRISEKCGVSDMGTALALQEFERDVTLVEQAGALLRELRPYEAEIRALIERKNRKGLVARLFDGAIAAVV